jgi:hypothetical protein
MPRRDPQKAIQVLDTMLEFFDGGRRWTRGMVLDASGQHRCLIGALEHIRGEFQFGGDGTLDFLHRALPDEQKKQTPIGCSIPKTLRPHHWLMYFNDRSSYDEVRALIVEARARAQAELDADRRAADTTTARSVVQDLGKAIRPKRPRQRERQAHGVEPIVERLH